MKFLPGWKPIVYQFSDFRLQDQLANVPFLVSSWRPVFYAQAASYCTFVAIIRIGIAIAAVNSSSLLSFSAIAPYPCNRFIPLGIVALFASPFDDRRNLKVIPLNVCIGMTPCILKSLGLAM